MKIFRAIAVVLAVAVPLSSALAGVEDVDHEILRLLGGQAPGSQGSSGQFLQTNGKGTLSWQSLAASSFGNQSANMVLAGPTSGGSATPTFRALVAADLGTTLDVQFNSIKIGETASNFYRDVSQGTFDANFGFAPTTATASGTNFNIFLTSKASITASNQQVLNIYGVGGATPSVQILTIGDGTGVKCPYLIIGTAAAQNGGDATAAQVVVQAAGNNVWAAPAAGTELRLNSTTAVSFSTGNPTTTSADLFLWRSGVNTLSVGTAGNNASGTLSAATLTGTLSTAAQANVTSLGTLTGLTITSTSATNADVLSVTKNPAGAQSGKGLNVLMGATTTGTAIFANQTTGASGALLDLQNNAASKFRATNGAQIILNNDVGLIENGSGILDVTDGSSTNNANLQALRFRVHSGVASAQTSEWSDGGGTYALSFGSSYVIRFASTNVFNGTMDTQISRYGAGVLGLAQNATGSAAEFRIYGTTDSLLTPTNSEYLSTSWSGSVCTIQTAKTGTGTVRALGVVVNGTLNLTSGTVSGTPTWSSNQAITLSTAAQPNVTSVGTLAGLTMTGTLSMSSTPVISGSPACTLGATTVTTLGLGAGNAITWSTRSSMNSSNDGLIEFRNNAGTGFTRLNFGGTSSSFPALTVSGANLNLTLADGTAGGAFITTLVQGNDGSTGTAAVFRGGAGSAGAGASGTFQGGNGAGTDKAAGGGFLSSGNSSGAGTSSVSLQVAPIQGSGSGTNTATTFLQISGNSIQNGSQLTYGCIRASTTLNTGSTSTNTAVVPAHSYVLGVVTRVTTTITTAANYAVKDNASTNTFIAATTNITSGSTATGITYSATTYYDAANTFVIITNANPGAGVVEVIIYYCTMTPPTS